MNDDFDLIIVGFLNEKAPRGILCNNVTITLTLKILTTFGAPRRLTPNTDLLSVSLVMLVFGLGCSPAIEMTPCSVENLREVFMS